MNLYERVLSSPTAVAALVGLVSLIVYLQTMVPGIGFIDSGELATVAHTLGIAHPTGYPLFTLLGSLASHLPWGGEEIQRLNIMAAVLCVIGLLLFFHTARRLAARAAGKHLVRTEMVLPAVTGGAFLLGFSETFWTQALAVEVYSLHLALIGAVLYACARATGDQGERWWYASAFLLGLSFTNHMTTVLLVPGLATWYFAHEGLTPASWKRLARLLPVFALGLSLYLYLPFRASMSPALNWGDPSTLERFLWHLSGKQYRVWLFASSDVAGKHLGDFFAGLPSEFAWVGIAAALAGLVVLWRAYRTVAIATVLFFVTCVAYAINYDIQDIDSYYLLAYWCIGLWGVFGLGLVGTWWMKFSGWGRHVTGIVLIVIACVPAAFHYKSVDQSDNHLVDDYTRTMFASLRPGALVLSYQWDYWVSASYYSQLVRGERPDLIIIDKELLRRSWYLKQLEHQHPALMAAVKEEVAAFRKELDKFEHGLPYAGGVIEGRFVGMIRRMIERGMERGPVYVTAEIEPEFTAGLLRVPEGLAFRVTRDTTYVPPAMPEITVRPGRREGRLESMVWHLYGNAYLARGDFFFRLGRLEEARKAYGTGLLRDPGSTILRSRAAMAGG